MAIPTIQQHTAAAVDKVYMGWAVPDGIPIVVGPIEVGAPKVEDEVVGEGIDVELLPDGIVDRLAGDVSVESGEECSHCGETIDVFKAIELGHIFKHL